MSLPRHDTEEQKQKLLTQLQQLRASAGWKILSKHIKELKETKMAVIMKVGGNELKHSPKDILIIETEWIDELLGLPDRFIDEIAHGTAEIPQEELDPFANNQQ